MGELLHELVREVQERSGSMSKYIPKIGDVIYNNGHKVVVVDMRTREDAGSCAYDRDYFLCDYEYISSLRGVVTVEDLRYQGHWVEVRGEKFPDVELAKDVPPYAIEKIEAFKFRQKVAKTITVFE